MNITSLAMSLLTPAVIGRIASALGINPTIAQMAISAALPAILGAIAGKARQPAGLGTLAGLLGQQDLGLLGQLGSVIGGSNQASMVSAGSGALGALLGAPGVGALTGAVGKFAGVPEAASTGLLGMLAPVALGTIAQQQTAGGLDAAGVATLLAGQTANIAAALPAGFSDLLKGTGLLDSVLPAAPAVPAAATDMATAAANAVKSAAAAAVTSVVGAGTMGAAAATAAQSVTKSATDAVSGAVARAPGAGAMAAATVNAVKTAIPEVAKSAPASIPAAAASVATASAAASSAVKSAASSATAVAADIIKPVAATVQANATPAGRMAAERMPELAPRGGSMLRWLLPLVALVVLGGLGSIYLLNRGPAMMAATPIVYNNVDVGAKATQLYGSLKTTVSGIKDSASATASLPKLQDADAQLGDIRDMAGKMPDATRKSLGSLFAKLEPGLEGLVESAIKAAGPESAVKPVLEQILRRMKSIAQG